MDNNSIISFPRGSISHGSSAVTVREIGYKKQMSSFANSANYDTETILMIRDVLPEEKVVNPGQTRFAHVIEAQLEML